MEHVPSKFSPSILERVQAGFKGMKVINTRNALILSGLLSLMACERKPQYQEPLSLPVAKPLVLDSFICDSLKGVMDARFAKINPCPEADHVHFDYVVSPEDIISVEKHRNSSRDSFSVLWDVPSCAELERFSKASGEVRNASGYEYIRRNPHIYTHYVLCAE